MTKNKPNLFSPRNVASAKKRVGKLLQKMKGAYSTGKMKLHLRLTVQYFQSMDARVVAVDKAYHKLGPSRRPNTLSQSVRLAVAGSVPKRPPAAGHRKAADQNRPSVMNNTSHT